MRGPNLRSCFCVRRSYARGHFHFLDRRQPRSIEDGGRSAGDHLRRGGGHTTRAVGSSRGHELGIRPRPSHIPHGASQDHWRGSLSSRLHSKRPRPPHPGQGTVGATPVVSCLRKSRFSKLPAISTPSWGSAPRLPRVYRPPGERRSPHLTGQWRVAPGVDHSARGLPAPPRVSPAAPAERRHDEQRDQKGCQIHGVHLPPRTSRTRVSARRARNAPVCARSPTPRPVVVRAREQPSPVGSVHYRIHHAPHLPREVSALWNCAVGWDIATPALPRDRRHTPINRCGSELSEPGTHLPFGVGPGNWTS